MGKLIGAFFQQGLQLGGKLSKKDFRRHEECSRFLHNHITIPGKLVAEEKINTAKEIQQVVK